MKNVSIVVFFVLLFFVKGLFETKSIIWKFQAYKESDVPSSYNPVIAMSVDNIENVDNIDNSVDNLDSNLYDNVASNDNLLSVCNENVDFTFNDDEDISLEAQKV